MATSLWPVLEDEDERAEFDEPSHAERLLAPFLCPPLPPPELGSTAPVKGPKLPPRWPPQPHLTRCASPASTTAVTPAVVVVVATLTIVAATPTVAGPGGRDCRCVPVFLGFVLPTLPPGFGQKTGSGCSS